MCIGERLDTLAGEDRAALSEAVRLLMPAYRLSWHANADAMVWAVLDHRDDAPRQPRFTICRLDRCLVLMTEAGPAARLFCSAATMTDAVGVAIGIVREMTPPFQKVARKVTPREAPALLQ